MRSSANSVLSRRCVAIFDSLLVPLQIFLCKLDFVQTKTQRTCRNIQNSIIQAITPQQKEKFTKATTISRVKFIKHYYFQKGSFPLNEIYLFHSYFLVVSLFAWIGKIQHIFKYVIFIATLFNRNDWCTHIFVALISVFLSPSWDRKNYFGRKIGVALVWIINWGNFLFERNEMIEMLDIWLMFHEFFEIVALDWIEFSRIISVFVQISGVN